MMWQAESIDVETEAQSVINLPRATNTQWESHGSNARLSHFAAVASGIPSHLPLAAHLFLPGILL